MLAREPRYGAIVFISEQVACAALHPPPSGEPDEGHARNGEHTHAAGSLRLRPRMATTSGAAAR